MENKKGALTIKFTITMVILIASFAIILFFYWQYNWKGQIDKDVCHESALLRHTFNVGTFEVGRQTIPLRCKTQKVCFYIKEKDCDFVDKSGVTYVKVSKVEDIEEEVANQMYDSWSTLGQGYFQLFHRQGYLEAWFNGDGLGDVDQDCITYAKIRFSMDVKEKYPHFNLARRLNEDVPNRDESYWDYFAGVGTEASEDILDLRVLGVEQEAVKVGTSSDIWVLYVEGRRRKNAAIQWMPLLGWKIAGVGDWYERLRTYVRGENVIMRFPTLVTMDDESLVKTSETCREFHEIV